MLKQLDPLLHSELRLGIMSILLASESSDFTHLKQQTGSTSGNLSVQLDKLSKTGYIEIQKGYRGKIPCTTCKITQKGIEAFALYVEALKSYFPKFPAK